MNIPVGRRYYAQAVNDLLQLLTWHFEDTVAAIRSFGMTMEEMTEALEAFADAYSRGE